MAETTSGQVREAFREGRIIRVLEEDPDDPDDGTVWYNSGENEYRGVEDGDVVTFDTTAVEE